MSILRWNPDQLRQGRTITPSTLDLPQTGGRAFQPAHESGPGVLETAGAVYQQETVLGSMYAYGGDELASMTRADPNFNPYKHWNDHREAYKDVEPYIRSGLLEGAENELQFQQRISTLRRELKNRKTVAEGSGWGQLLGMGLSLIDLATLVPVAGELKAGERLVNAAKLAAGGAGIAAGQEVILHGLQDRRTIDESIMNIGVSGLFGAGIGAWATTARPKDPLNPNHPQNPLKIDSDWEFKLANRGADDGDHVVLKPDGVSVPPRRSAGAAESVADETTKIESQNARIYEQAIKKSWREWKPREWAAVLTHGPARALDSVTPAGRLLMSPFETARRSGTKLFDTGGVLTNRMFRGESTFSAEDWKTFYTNWFGEFDTDLGERIDRLNREVLGLKKRFLEDVPKDWQARTDKFIGDYTGITFPETPKVKKDEFIDWTRQVLFDNELAGRSPEWVLANTDLGGKLKHRFGEQAPAVLKEVRSQVDSIHNLNQRLEDEMVATGMIDEDQRMGRDYKAAVLFDSKGITLNQHDFKAFLRRMLAGHPSEEFLQEYGLTPQQFEKLDPVDKNQILSDWVGDIEQAKMVALQERKAELEKDLALNESALKAVIASSQDVGQQYKAARIKELEQAVRAQRDRARQFEEIIESFRRREEEVIKAAEVARKAGENRQFRVRPDVKRQPAGKPSKAESKNINLDRAVEAGKEIYRAKGTEGAATSGDTTRFIQTYVDLLSHEMGLTEDIQVKLERRPGSWGSYVMEGSERTLFMDTNLASRVLDVSAPDAVRVKALDTIHHEFGHAIVFSRIFDAPRDVKEELVDGWMKWISQSPGVAQRLSGTESEVRSKMLKALESGDSFEVFHADKEIGALLSQGVSKADQSLLARQRSPLSGRAALEKNLNSKMGLPLDPGFQSHLVSWNEYMAEGISKFLSANPPEAQGFGQKFFKSIADALKRLFVRITGKEGAEVAPQEIERFMREVILADRTGAAAPNSTGRLDVADREAGGGLRPPGRSLGDRRRSAELARLEGELRQIRTQRKSAQRKLERVRHANEKAQQLLDQRKALRKELAEAKRDIGLAKTELDKLSRRGRKKLRTAERRLEKRQNARGLNEYVDDLTRKLTRGRESVGDFISEDEVFETGRALSRKLPWTDGLRREAMAKGFIRSDLEGILYQQVEQTAGRLGMRRAFGSEDMADIIGQPDKPGGELRIEYEQMYEQAVQRGATDRELAGITRSYEKARRDLLGIRDRVLGTAYNVDPENLLVWTGRKLRQLNFLRLGSGFGVSSLPDVMSAAFHLGSTSRRGRKLLKDQHQTLWKMGRQAAQQLSKADDEVMRKWLSFSEHYTPRSQQLSGTLEGRGYDQQGIGAYGSRTHQLTRGVDRAFGGLSDLMGTASGMRHFTMYVKSLAMVAQQHRIQWAVKHYDDLLAKADAGDRDARLTIGDLASVGIGVDEVPAIRKMIELNPVGEDDFSLGIQRWLNHGEEGRRAYATVAMSMERLANRASPTPGVADRPLLMDNETAQFFLQFTTFGYVAWNRLIRPLRQSVLGNKEWENVSTLGGFLALGLLVQMIRDKMNGHNTFEDRSASEIIYNSWDRAGLFGYLSPASNAVFESVFGGDANKYQGYSQWWQHLLGPTAGAASDIGVAAYRASEGDTSAVMEKLVRLAPFGNLYGYMDKMATAYGD